MSVEKFRKEFVVDSLGRLYNEIHDLLQSADEEDFTLPSYGSSISWHIGYITDMLTAIVTEDMQSIRANRTYYFLNKPIGAYSTESTWRRLYRHDKNKTIEDFRKAFGDAFRIYTQFSEEVFSEERILEPYIPFTEKLAAYEYLKRLIFVMHEQKGMIEQIISVSKESKRCRVFLEKSIDIILPEHRRIKYFPELIAYLDADFFRRQSNRPIFSNSLSLSEIHKMEAECGVKFPASFVEFLLITGNDWGNIIESQTGGERAEYLKDLQNIPGEFISEEIPPENYPKDILIISTEYSGQQIIYFKKSEMISHDPPIYYALLAGYELEAKNLPYLETQLNEHFSGYINHICHYKLREEVERQTFKEPTP